MQAILTMQIREPDMIKGYQVIEFTGEFDKVGFSEVNEQLEEVMKAIPVPTLVFDFRHLKFINSEGIGFLMELHSQLMKSDKRLIIVGAKAHIKDVFDAIGIAEIITVLDKLEDYKTK